MEIGLLPLLMFFEEQAADRLCFAPSPYGALPLAGSKNSSQKRGRKQRAGRNLSAFTASRRGFLSCCQAGAPFIPTQAADPVLSMAWVGHRLILVLRRILAIN